MRAHRLSAFVVLVLFGASLLACGGGGGGGVTTPAADPTITDVTPTTGPTGGGTGLVITGTNFADGATVTVGGNPATAVDVADATTINCLAPAGTAGTAAVAVTVGGVTATWSGSFTYVAAAAPTFLTVTPVIGTTFGGTELTISGTGFTANAAGPNVVMVHGIAATGVNTVDDTTIICYAPAVSAGTNATGTVTVTNANGTTSPGGSYTYFEPILVADGGGAPPPAIWNLTAIDPATGMAYLIGSIGFGVSGMDFHPTTGVLYATTDPGTPNGRQLIWIDPQSGRGTAVGPLDSPAMPTPINHPVTDCSFVGGVLYGTDGPPPVPFGNLVTINLTNGAVTIAGANTAAVGGVLGGALASNAAGTVVNFMASDTGSLYAVTVGTSTFTAVATLPGIGHPVGAMLGATYHNGVLHAVDADVQNPGLGSGRTAVTVSLGPTPPAGTITPLGFWGPLPPYARAMASRTR